MTNGRVNDACRPRCVNDVLCVHGDSSAASGVAEWHGGECGGDPRAAL